MRISLLVLCLAILAGFATAQKDDFKREGDVSARQRKDPLEGKVPPQLNVGKWLNAQKDITLASLKGKVVVLDFWGTW